MTDLGGKIGLKGDNLEVRIGASQVLFRYYHGKITGILKKEKSLSTDFQ